MLLIVLAQQVPRSQCTSTNRVACCYLGHRNLWCRISSPCTKLLLTFKVKNLNFATTSILPRYVSFFGFIKEKVSRRDHDDRIWLLHLKHSEAYLRVRFSVEILGDAHSAVRDTKAAGIKFLTGFKIEFFLFTPPSSITSEVVYSSVDHLPIASIQQKVPKDSGLFERQWMSSFPKCDHGPWTSLVRPPS